MFGRKVIYVRFINCSYNNVAKGIRLLDKKAIFVYTGKIHARKSFLKDLYPLSNYTIYLSASIQLHCRTSVKSAQQKNNFLISEP